MTSHMRHSTASRHSLASAAAPSSTSRDALPPLPPYKKPSHPLTPSAQQRLRELYSQRTSQPLKNHNDEAVKCITETAASINDHLRERAERVERRRKKWEQGKNLESQEAEEEELRLMKEKVEKLTETLEKAIRGCIDEGMGARRIEEVLEWLRREANVLMEREYETQVSQRSQAQSQSQRRRQTGGEDDMYEDEGPTPGPTPLGRERVALTGLSEMFVDRMDRKKDEYSMFSHQARYAQNNDYIGFKQLVHDARYGDDGPPLPHPDTWFSKRGRPALGVTAPQTAGEDDDDLIIDKANISIRCPITFGKFQEPYSSKKCPHTFEKTAILSMIRNARPRGSVQCPVSGCDQILTPDDLHSDLVLIRKIKRLEQAEARENAESDVEIDSDDEVAAPRASVRNLKAENGDDEMSDAGVPATQGPPRSSNIVDLGDPSDDDDDEDE